VESLAESLQVPKESVQISRVTFEVRSSFSVQGLSLQDWNRASAKFRDTMEQRLGFPVVVTAVQVREVDGGKRRRLKQAENLPLLDVSYTVHDLQETASTAQAIAEIDAVASHAKPASLEDPGNLSPIEIALLRSFPSNEQPDIQVSFTSTPNLEFLPPNP
jgi:hypothetical protein